MPFVYGLMRLYKKTESENSMNALFDLFMNPPNTGVSQIAGRTLKPSDGFLALIGYVCALLTALILHECAHGFAALKCGDDTAKLSGRLSLNPKNHLDLVGTICMFVCGIGWAKPVPINPAKFRKNYRASIFFVSIAGVTVNIILAFLSLGFYDLVCAITLSAATTVKSSGLLYAILYVLSVYFIYGTIMNIGLFLFNLIPLFPLDGSHILDLILPQNSAVSRFLRRYGIIILYCLIGLSFIADITGIVWFDILGLYLYNVRNLIYNLFGSFWSLIFGGLF